jgi:hypothetical protein
MIPTADYKSKELNLYNDEGYKLQVRQTASSSEAGVGFSFKTTNLQGAGDWGVYIPQLKVDTMDGVRGVGSMIGMHEYHINNLNVNLPAEVLRATNAEAVLQQNINAEASIRASSDTSHSNSIASEISDRQIGDYNLDVKIVAEISRATAAELVLTNHTAQIDLDVKAESKARSDSDATINNALVAESAARIAADFKFSGDLSAESAARSSADTVLTTNLANESTERKSDVARLDGRIDFITHNTDQAALDSLSEIVSNFNVNGASYASRLTWLEGIVQELVNRTQ